MRALASWACPLVAWASQIALTIAMSGVRGAAPIWFFALVFQFVMIITGLYTGAKVLSLGKRAVAKSVWWQAVAGLVLSGGTILLIVVMAIKS